jgi:hypothetical protein
VGTVDCCDTDSRARPNSTYSGTVATACGGFDYNCDGKEWYGTNSGTYPWVVTTTLCTYSYSSNSCGNTNNTGWVDEVPACGVSGSHQTCYLANSITKTCALGVSTRKPDCY